MQLNLYGILIQAHISSKYIEELLISEFSFWESNPRRICDEKLNINIVFDDSPWFDKNNTKVLNTDENTYYFKKNLVYIKPHHDCVVAKINILQNDITISIKHEDIKTYLFVKAVLNSFIAYILKKNNVYRVHGSVMAQEQKVIILLGASGTGKSTSAYYLIQEGFDYFGDDILYLRFTKEGVDILPYPNNLSTDLYESDRFIKFKDGYRTKSLIPLKTKKFPLHYQLYIISLSLYSSNNSVIEELTFEEKCNILTSSFINTPFEHFEHFDEKEKFNLIYSLIQISEFKGIGLGTDKDSFVKSIEKVINNPTRAQTKGVTL